MLMFLLIGVAAGALTGVPIGPANVAVIDAAYRHTLRRAIAVAAGAALADGLCAALGVVGIKPWLDSHPRFPPVLWAISGIVLLVYGYVTASSRAAPPPPPVHEADVAQSQSTVNREEAITGFKIGLALILLNPAAIITWIFLMGSAIMPAMTRVEGVACAVGVIVGSFGWFSLVAYLTHKGKSVLGEKAAWIPRVVGILLMIYAVYLLAKAVRFFVFT